MEIYKLIFNDLVDLANNRVFFFPYGSTLIPREEDSFSSITGTYLLVMKGLPEEGTEWENKVSFMLVTGLGGLKQSTVCTDNSDTANEKLSTISKGKGMGKSGFSLAQDQ